MGYLKDIMGKDDIRLAKRETKTLGHQNFSLCDVIAETRALQAYFDYLEEERYLLNGGGLIPRDVAQKELDDGYDEEIVRLEELLEACQERERSIEFELQQAQESLQEAEKQHADAFAGTQNLQNEADAATEEAKNAALEYNKLDNDVEELRSTLEFRQKICEEELDNVRDYVDNWNEAAAEGSEAGGPGLDPTQKYKSEKDYNDNKDIDRMLSEFANNYQQLLDEAYALEKETLQKEVEGLLHRRKDLQDSIQSLRERKDAEQEAIKQLKEEKILLEREMAQLTTERANMRKAWEKERTDMEKQIDKINEEIQSKEAELARLVALDNKLVTQACELELEIQGYKAMMINESGNF